MATQFLRDIIALLDVLIWFKRIGAQIDNGMWKRSRANFK